MPQEFFDSWAKFVVCTRLVLSIVALLVMLFFAVVSTEGRLVPALVVFAVSFVLYRDLRTLRRWRQPRQ
jgi:hypothetical protein